MEQIPVLTIVLIIFIVFILMSAIRVLKEYERGVVFRLGRVLSQGARGPGLILLIPVLDGLRKLRRCNQVVLDFYNGFLRLHHAEIYDRIDFYGYVILGDHILRRYIHHHGA